LPLGTDKPEQIWESAWCRKSCHRHLKKSRTTSFYCFSSEQFSHKHKAPPFSQPVQHVPLGHRPSHRPDSWSSKDRTWKESKKSPTTPAHDRHFPDRYRQAQATDNACVLHRIAPPPLCAPPHCPKGHVHPTATLFYFFR